MCMMQHKTLRDNYHKLKKHYHNSRPTVFKTRDKKNGKIAMLKKLSKKLFILLF